LGACTARTFAQAIEQTEDGPCSRLAWGIAEDDEVAIDTDSLLALKAFHLGRAIADRTPHRAAALRMIDSAIAQLEQAEDDRSQMRLLFYVLLKAEAVRTGPDALALRGRAQSIAERIGSKSFDLFMNIEALTQSTSRVHGLQIGIISDQGIRPTTLRSYEVRGPISTFCVVEDDACLAVGVERMSLLSSKQRHFVYDMSLKDILDHHGIRYAP
jgi:hypothetical protein